MSARNRIMIAVATGLVIASMSPSLAIDVSREQQLRQAERFNARAEARPKRARAERAATIPGEPFTAEEKRVFQTPTGREINRW
jgi:hypothetical protein